MVLRQCLACNTTVLGSLQICTCGHVFEDVRQIGGKRFSEYRARLYTRLEAKQTKYSDDEKKVLGDSETSDEEQIILKPKKKSRSIPSSRKPQSNKTTRKSRKKSKVEQKHHVVSKPPSPFQSAEEEAARFSWALNEINRRIMGQTMMWLSL